MKLELGGSWRVTPDEVAAALYNYTSDAFFVLSCDSNRWTQDTFMETAWIVS